MGILRGVDVSIIAPINGQTMFRQGTQPPLLPLTSTLVDLTNDHAVSYYTILHNIMQYFLICKASPQFHLHFVTADKFSNLIFHPKKNCLKIQ